MIQDNVNKFNAKHPDIDVHMTDVAQETYCEGALARMLGNVPTDVMYADVSQQVAFEAAGYVVPTEDYFPEIRKYEKDFTKGYWPGVVNKEGKMIGLQYYGDYTGLWYNPRHLQKAGIHEPPKTWEDLLDQCLKMKQKGIAEFPCGAFFGSYGFWQTLYALLECSILSSQHTVICLIKTTTSYSWMRRAHSSRH
jgi:multiple sugar transport system substrate-binding protein